MSSETNISENDKNYAAFGWDDSLTNLDIIAEFMARAPHYESAEYIGQNGVLEISHDADGYWDIT